MKFDIHWKTVSQNVAMEVTDIMVTTKPPVGLRGGVGTGAGYVRALPEGHSLSVRYKLTMADGRVSNGEWYSDYLPSSNLELIKYIQNEFETKHPDFQKKL